jgi:hypothetical protein
VNRFTTIIALVLALFVAAPAVASAEVTLPAGVVQAGPTTFVAQPTLCSCQNAIDGYSFAGMPYSPFVRDSFLKLPATDPTAIDVWSLLRSQPDYQPGAPIYSVSVSTTVSGTVPPSGGGDGSLSSLTNSPNSYSKGSPNQPNSYSKG